MEMHERVRHLRKNVLKMTQEKFGTILGVNRDVIANLEKQCLVRPEQKEPLYKLICKEFNVNYEWLTTRQGEMFFEKKKAFLDKLEKEMDLNPTLKSVIEIYLNMGDEQRVFFDAFLRALDETSKSTPGG